MFTLVFPVTHVSSITSWFVKYCSVKIGEILKGEGYVIMLIPSDVNGIKKTHDDCSLL